MSSTSAPRSSGYRADIDGLRAVAVLAVVLYHAFPSRMPGGFLGVDIFFVISGFLITNILLEGHDRSTFSLADFYARRAKRIFPALALVLAATLLGGWLVLLPSELERLGKHVVAGTTFVSNFTLLSEAGYFDTGAETKPLLHLWSLAIEEQFYLAWPWLIAISRRRRLTALMTITTLLGSFAANLVLLHTSPAVAFFSPFCRFWELLAGGALAMSTRAHRDWLGHRSSYERHLVGLLGAGIVGASFAFIDQTQPFPGWRALLPVLGTTLVIAAGPTAFFNSRCLSLRPLVWVGLISFPLYLWHWPLLTWLRILEPSTPSTPKRLIAIVTSIVLAWLTTRLLEARLRFNKHRAVIPALASALVLLAGIGLACSSNGGFAEARGPWNVDNVGTSFGKEDQYDPLCRAAEAARYLPAFNADTDFCRYAGPHETPNVIVLGDSHASRVYAGLADDAPNAVWNFGRASCLPFFGYEAAIAGTARALDCSPTMTNLLDRAIAARPRVVVLSGFFARPYDGRMVLRGDEDLRSLMRTTMVRLSSAVPQTVVVMDVPELPFEPSTCVDRPVRRASDRACSFDRSAHTKQNALYVEDLRAATAALPNVSIFDPTDVLCDATQCFGIKDRQLLYDDRHHLSHDGARRVAAALRRQLNVRGSELTNDITPDVAPQLEP